MEWNYLSAEELTAALRVGEVTSVELTDEAIARIEREDKVINAICVPDFDRARAAAHRADQERARGEDRPLLGVPVTVKECYNIAGLPTTWGMPQYRDYMPAEDAVQVSRLKAAGAVVLGKTNVPLGMQGLQSFNEIYGTTTNPWDHGRTSGGSSGGSAAALASGFGALSIGSDIAGSLRTPAHFCGVYGHKPTLGLVANRGMVLPTTPALPVDLDLAVVGPMARTARDLTLLLDVMAGPDPLTFGVAHDLTLPPAPRAALRLPGPGPRRASAHSDRVRCAGGREPGGRRARRRRRPRRTAQSTAARPDRSRDALHAAADFGLRRAFSHRIARAAADPRRRTERGRPESRCDAAACPGVQPRRLDGGEQPSRTPPPRLAAAVRRVRCRGVPGHAHARVPA
jgi:Asp-tRNA(Asn)/Glu-tRNA(Gln) amidotransferase A subunit family amidase